MKLCINCGVENQATATYCSTCGLALTDSFSTSNRTSKAGKPRIALLIAVAISIAGIAAAIFMLNGGGVDKNSGTTTTVAQDEKRSHREHDAEPSEPEPEVTPARVSQKLKNVNNPGNYVIDDETLSTITARINHFIEMNNSEDVDALLDCFNYPVQRYHRNYKISRVKLRNILTSTTDAFHKLSPSLSNGTVAFDGRNYEVIFYARYQWATLEAPGYKRSKRLRLKYIMNKNFQITSAYEM